MELAKKTKVWFPQPVVMEIGDPIKLMEKEKAEAQARVVEVRGMGFTEGALVTNNNNKRKHDPDTWGVIVRVFDNYPMMVDRFEPLFIKWFTGASQGSRIDPASLYLICCGPDEEFIAALENE